MAEVLPGGGRSRYARGFVWAGGTIAVLMLGYMVAFTIIDPFGDPTDYDKVPENFGHAFTASGAPVAYAVVGNKIERRVLEAPGEAKDMPDVSAPDGVRFTSFSPPRFSSDLARVAFVGAAAGEGGPAEESYGLYVLTVADETSTRVADLDADGSDLAFSADGRQVAFTDYVGDQLEIFVVIADARDRRRVTNDPASDTEPAFSPDGKRVVFSSDRGEDRDLYAANVDGTGVTRLTKDAADDWRPVFSPDGKRLAWDRGPDPADSGGTPPEGPFVHVANVDGTDRKRLAGHPDGSRAPVFSPDGTRIVYSQAGADDRVFVMNADGSGAGVVYAWPDEV